MHEPNNNLNFADDISCHVTFLKAHCGKKTKTQYTLMKRTILKTFAAAMLLCVGGAFTANAQTLKVTVPKGNLFFQVMKEGVNMRRQPNAKSGKLMVWNSDAGSEDTYTKLFFSDTEAARYRPSRNTGAFVEPFHPEQGDWLIGSCTLDGDQNGFYKAIVTAPEYANTGQGNAKIAWVSGDLVRIIEKDPEGHIENETFPLWQRYNPEKGETEYGSMTKVGKGVKRVTGNYTGLELFFASDNVNNVLFVTSAIVYDGYLLVSRASFDVEHDASLPTEFAIEKLEEENEIGDVDVRYVIKMKSDKKMALNAELCLLTCSDNQFKLFVDALFPNGEVPTNEVYVSSFGPAECISYKNIPASLGETKTYIMNCKK